MHIFGYARVSTHRQSLDIRIERLKNAGGRCFRNCQTTKDRTINGLQNNSIILTQDSSRTLIRIGRQSNEVIFDCNVSQYITEFEKAIGSSGIPDKVNMDKSGANKAGVDTINLHLAMMFMLGGLFVKLIVRQIKYANNIIEQNHRCITSPKITSFIVFIYFCDRTLFGRQSFTKSTPSADVTSH